MEEIRCATKNCRGLCEKRNEKFAWCTHCYSMNCLSCRAIHEWENCYSYALRSKLDEAEVADLQTLYNQNFIRNGSMFACKCRNVVMPGEGLILKNCLHLLCRPCINEAVERSRNVLVACPVAINASVLCGQLLEATEINEVIPPELQQRRLDLNLQGAHDERFSCLWKCGANFPVDESTHLIECPKCHHVNCVRCKSPHEGMNCDDYQKLRMEKWVQKGKEYVKTGMFLYAICMQVVNLL